MPLPSSGVISLTDVRIELEKPSSTISLTDTAARALAGKPTGMIVMPQDLWGKTAAMTIELSRTIYNFNLVNVVDGIQSGYRGAVNLNFYGAVIVATLGNYAFNLYGQFADIRLRNPVGYTSYGRNYILGYGGSGGAGGTAGANNGQNGAPGGTAMKFRYGGGPKIEGASFTYPSEGKRKEYGNWLSIYGGGGGGGGGGGASINQNLGGYYSASWSTNINIKAAGGGGGAGQGGLTGSLVVSDGGGAAGSGQTASASIYDITTTSTAPKEGQGAGAWNIVKYYSPETFELNSSLSNASGGAGGKVVAVSAYQTNTQVTAIGGAGGAGGSYGSTAGSNGSPGNIGSFSGSVGAGGTAGAGGEAFTQSV